MKLDSLYKADEVEPDEQQEEPVFKIQNDDMGIIDFKENEWYLLQMPQILNMAAPSKRRFVDYIVYRGWNTLLEKNPSRKDRKIDDS